MLTTVSSVFLVSDVKDRLHFEVVRAPPNNSPVSGIGFLKVTIQVRDRHARGGILKGFADPILADPGGDVGQFLHTVPFREGYLLGPRGSSIEHLDAVSLARLS